MMNSDIFRAARGKDFALRRSHFLNSRRTRLCRAGAGTSVGSDGRFGGFSSRLVGPAHFQDRRSRHAGDDRLGRNLNRRKRFETGAFRPNEGEKASCHVIAAKPETFRAARVSSSVDHLDIGIIGKQASKLVGALRPIGLSYCDAADIVLPNFDQEL
jgi:hypothetical protein